MFSPAVTLLYFTADKLSFGVAVSKKHGKAVRRNKIKRLLRAAFFNTCDFLEGNYSVIAIPKIAEKYSLKDFESSFLLCFKKVKACSKS